MRIDSDPIENEKPTADRQEQERPDVDEVDDPEVGASATPQLGAVDANPADVLEQAEEVPDDEDHPRD